MTFKDDQQNAAAAEAGMHGEQRAVAPAPTSRRKKIVFGAVAVGVIAVVAIVLVFTLKPSKAHTATDPAAASSASSASASGSSGYGV